jgi:lactate dehydrogenase-like 2-hydroxyacid dehydrogenase
LKFIIRAEPGFNNINVESASKYRIHVCGTGGINNDAVAELAEVYTLKSLDEVLDLQKKKRMNLELNMQKQF